MNSQSMMINLKKMNENKSFIFHVFILHSFCLLRLYCFYSLIPQMSYFVFFLFIFILIRNIKRTFVCISKISLPLWKCICSDSQYWTFQQKIGTIHSSAIPKNEHTHGHILKIKICNEKVPKMYWYYYM